MNPLQLQIFFVGYLVGYIICAYCLQVGVVMWRNNPQIQEVEWQLRKSWRWRLLTSERWGKFVVALYSLAWPWLMTAAVMQIIRQKAEPDFDLNRLRHCSEDLNQWCQASPYAVIYVTVLRCEVPQRDWWCNTALLCMWNNCSDPDGFDTQMCQGFAL